MQLFTVGPRFDVNQDILTPPISSIKSIGAGTKRRASIEGTVSEVGVIKDVYIQIIDCNL